MDDKLLTNLPEEELLTLFNNQIYSERIFDESDFFDEFLIRDIPVKDVFPRLFNVFYKKEDDCFVELELIKKSQFSQIRDFFVSLLYEIKHKKVLYYLLEALGNLSWKDNSISSYYEFKYKLESFVEQAEVDNIVFIARVIAYWHFNWELDSIEFDCTVSFSQDEIELIKPLLHRILDFIIKFGKPDILGLDAIYLIGKYKLIEFLPELAEIMNCVLIPKDFSYDIMNDHFHYLREKTIETLMELDVPECLPILIEALQTEPSWENFIQIIYAIGVLKQRDALPYIYAVRQGLYGGNLKYFDQNELNKATKYVLDKFDLFPSPTKFAAERLVFFQYTDFNEIERDIFLKGVPSIEEGYEKFFEYLEEHLLIAEENFLEFKDSKTFYRNLARALLYIGLPEEFLLKEKFISQFSNPKIKIIAEKIFPYFKSEKVYATIDSSKYDYD